jgi:hypothetical protein
VKYIIALSICLSIAVFTYKTFESINAEAICKSSDTTTPYCRYKGEIEKIYINSNGLALLFLNKNFNVEDAKKFGYDVTAGNIVAIDLNNETQFSRELFDMATLAFQQDLLVEIHARGTINGYLTVDRIWVNK